MMKVLRQKAPFLLLAAGIWLGVLLFGRTGLSRQSVTLSYRIPPAATARVLDLEISLEGTLERRSEVALPANQTHAAVAVSLAPGRYDVRAMITGDQSSVLQARHSFAVPGADPQTITLGAHP